MSTEEQRTKTRERVKRYRAKQQIKALHGSVTHPDTCRCCSESLPKLLRPRRWPGMCYDCAMKYADRYMDTDELWPEYRYSNDSDYVMTAFEREHYKPASKLGKGEYNPVSLPGDKHYKVV